MDRYIIDPYDNRVVGMLFKNATQIDEYVVMGGESDDFILISANSPEKALEKLKIMQYLAEED